MFLWQIAKRCEYFCAIQVAIKVLNDNLCDKGYHSLSKILLIADDILFVFEDTCCKQVFGKAMSSPVSAVIANLVMEGVENRSLTRTHVSPSFLGDLLMM